MTPAPAESRTPTIRPGLLQPAPGLEAAFPLVRPARPRPEPRRTPATMGVAVPPRDPNKELFGDWK